MKLTTDLDSGLRKIFDEFLISGGIDQNCNRIYCSFTLFTHSLMPLQ